MGNLCGDERLEKSSLMKSKLCLSKVIGRAFVQILQGDILSESTSAILNVAHDPYSTQFIKIQQSSINTRPKLIAGFPIIAPFQQNGIPFVIHLKIPSNFHILEQEDQIQTFVDVFELASSKNIECISFTEPPKDIALNQKKDIYAKLLLSAFQFFIFNSSDPKIILLKVINPDQNTTNIYMKELLQIAVISTKQSYEVEPNSNIKEQSKKQQDITNIQPTFINIEQKLNLQITQQNGNEELQKELKQQETLQLENESNKIIQQQSITIENKVSEIQQKEVLVQDDKIIVEPPQQINNLEFEYKKFINDYSEQLVSDILQKSIENMQTVIDS